MNMVADTPSPVHSSLFRASVPEEAVNVEVMANQGADTNLVSAAFLKDIQKHDPKLFIQNLHLPHTYESIPSEWCVTWRDGNNGCTSKTTQGAYLILRNKIWKVSREEIDPLIIGRRVLEPIGCDNRAKLEAAHEKLTDDVDVADKLEHDGNMESKF